MPYTFSVVYGYWCVRPTQGVPDENSACFSNIASAFFFTVTLAPSDLDMIVDFPTVTTGNASQEFEYIVHLASSEVGLVEMPLLQVTVPPGMSLVSAKYLVTQGNPLVTGTQTVFPSNQYSLAGNVYTFDVDQAAFGGMGMPGISYCDVIFRFNASCVPPHFDPKIVLMFASSGFNLCEALPPNGPQPAPALTITPGGNSNGQLPDWKPGRTLACTESTDPIPADYPTVYDNCGNIVTNPILSKTDVNTLCGVLRTWHVTVCGNEYIQQPPQVLTCLSELQPPHIDTCPRNRDLAVNAQCQAVMPDMTGEVVATDNCRIAKIVQSPPPGMVLTPGSHPVSFTVTDECGNSATCNTTIVTVPSGITFQNCPPNISRACDDETGRVVDYIDPTATSLCCSGNVVVSCFPPSHTKFPIGVTTGTCTATICGTTSTCTFTVTVTAHGPSQWAWAKRRGGTGLDSGKALAVDGQGNVFVTGTFTNTITLPGSPSITLTSAGGSDIFIAKYDSAGTLLWAARGGGPLNDLGSATALEGGVAVDNAGNAYMTGSFNTQATFEHASNVTAFQVNSAGGRDVFIVKYDPAGTCLWASAAGGVGEDYGAGIAWDRVNDKVFVTGALGTGSAPNSAPNRQAFVLPVATGSGSVGAPALSAPILNGDTTQDARGRAIAVDDAGSPYVTGIYSAGAGAGTKFVNGATVPTPGGIFIVKFNNALTSSAATHCVHQSPGTAGRGFFDAFGIAVSAENPPLSGNHHCYVTGNFYGSNTDTLPGVANFGNGILVKNIKATPPGQLQLNDYFIAKFNSLGLGPLHAVWAVKGGDENGFADLTSNDETRALALDAAENVYVTGFRKPGATTPFVNEGPTVLVASHHGSDGTLRWTRHATDASGGPPPQDIGLGITLDGADCVHVTGDFTETLDFPPVLGSPISSGSRDMFVAKMCPSCACTTPVAVHCSPNKSVECNEANVGEGKRGLKILHEFAPSGGDGQHPRGSLVEASDGLFYGTSYDGGNFGVGTIFVIAKDGSRYRVLYHCDSLGNGRNPAAGLIQGRTDHLLYGTMQFRAVANNVNRGAVFKIDTNGGYMRLHGFVNTGEDGRQPLATVVEGTEGLLYGTTIFGGAPNLGTVFRLAKDGMEYARVYDFVSTGQDGTGPMAPLVSDGAGALFGTTRGGGGGGTSGLGTIFKLNEGGPTLGYQQLHKFSTDPSPGSFPTEALVLGPDGRLYGTTSVSASGRGTILRIEKNGTGFVKMRTFGVVPDAATPQGSLCQASDGALYGTTKRGGIYDKGAIFKFDRDGTHYSVIHSFGATATDARQPSAGLIQGSDGAFYGTTEFGGTGNAGTVFRLLPDCDLPFDPPTAEDACCEGNGIAVTVLSTTTTGTGCAKSCTRTWEVKDCFGNTTVCSQTITVEDHTPPRIITVPLTLDRDLECSDPDLPAKLAEAIMLAPEAEDLCSIPSIDPFGDTTVATCGSSYVRTRKWNFSDACGNMSPDYVQTIRVRDTHGPAINVPQDVIVGCNAIPVGPATLPASDLCDATVTTATLNADAIATPSSDRGRRRTIAGTRRLRLKKSMSGITSRRSLPPVRKISPSKLAWFRRWCSIPVPWRRTPALGSSPTNTRRQTAHPAQPSPRASPR